jgi:hypothetical protein
VDVKAVSRPDDPFRTDGAHCGAMVHRALLGCVAMITACAVTKPIRVEPIDPPPSAETAPIEVESPIKAHLLDGSTVVFENGARVTSDAVLGQAVRYDAALKPMGAIERIPLDSVSAMEAYPPNLDVPRTVVYSAASAVIGVFGFAALMVAIFGSCPTVYADSAGTAVLEAETFSYSIAPLFESRDVDRLAAQADPDGGLTLEIRNEALETHSLNHLELLDVAHDRSEHVLPDERDVPVALADLRAPRALTDRAGRDLRATLAAADGMTFASAEPVLAGATAGDLEDWIDLVAELPAGADSVAIVLRLRNSLLNTVLFYDVMLAAQGVGALDWVGRDLARIGEAARLGRWFHARMGMRVASLDRHGRPVERRIADAGPIAWKDVAVVVPAPAEGPLRARLSFVADQWRIDRIEVGARVRRPLVRTVALAEVRNASGEIDAAALEALGAPDDAYVVTGPGTRFTARFGIDAAPSGRSRTLLLAAQGYYVEWIRRDWIRRGAGTPFQPSDEALLSAMRRWRTVQHDLEETFFAARVPVR